MASSGARSLERAASRREAVNAGSGDWNVRSHAAERRTTRSWTLELDRRTRVLRRIEKTPLTEEQARAVICFDNRVQLVASAGSGKTSTMVAKAGWTIRKAHASADEILAARLQQGGCGGARRTMHCSACQREHPVQRPPRHYVPRLRVAGDW